MFRKKKEKKNTEVIYVPSMVIFHGIQERKDEEKGKKTTKKSPHKS